MQRFGIQSGAETLRVEALAVDSVQQTEKVPQHAVGTDGWGFQVLR